MDTEFSEIWRDTSTKASGIMMRKKVLALKHGSQVIRNMSVTFLKVVKMAMADMSGIKVVIMKAISRMVT